MSRDPTQLYTGLKLRSNKLRDITPWSPNLMTCFSDSEFNALRVCVQLIMNISDL